MNTNILVLHKCKTFSICFLSILFSVIFCSCGSGPEQDTENIDPASVNITAAGATFPAPFYNLVIKEYTKKTGIKITYGGIGSSGGIRSLKDKVVDFGATDAFLSSVKEAEMSSEVVHIPTCIGAVVIAYNIPGIDSLQLSNNNLSDIFMGRISNWNDPELVKTNNGIELPDLPITLVHRSDGSGTTYIFSDFMSKISADWEKSVGKGKSLKWPVGGGAKGNSGVAATIFQNDGAIGYIGSEFAFTQNVSFARIENSAGKYIMPDFETIGAVGKGEIPPNTKVMLTNSSNPEAYPICGFTWLILYKEQKYDNRTKIQAKETVKFLSWIIGEEARDLAKQVNYAPLPEKAASRAKDLLSTIVYDGNSLFE